MSAIVSRTAVARIGQATWEWPGRFAPLLVIVLSLMLSGCASGLGLPRAAGGAKVEEWGWCSHPEPGANILCLEVRRPL